MKRRVLALDEHIEFSLRGKTYKPTIPGAKILNKSGGEALRDAKSSLEEKLSAATVKDAVGLTALAVTVSTVTHLSGFPPVWGAALSLGTFTAAAIAVDYMGDGFCDSIDRLHISPSWKGALAGASSSAPEFLSSTIAATMGGGIAAMAIANYIGSNLFNPLIVAGGVIALSALASSQGNDELAAAPIRFDKRHKKDSLWMLGTTAYVSSRILDGDFTCMEALPLIATFPLYLHSLRHGEAETIENGEADGLFTSMTPTAAAAGGGIGLYISADTAVNSLKRFVEYARMPAELAGKTFLAISTSIPEAAIVKGYYKQIKRALQQGEPIGELWQRGTHMMVDTVQMSNIFNMYFLSATALITRFTTQSDLTYARAPNDIATMLLEEGVLVYSALRGRMTRAGAATIGGAYALNMAYNVISTLN